MAGNALKPLLSLKMHPLELDPSQHVVIGT